MTRGWWLARALGRVLVSGVASLAVVVPAAGQSGVGVDPGPDHPLITAVRMGDAGRVRELLAGDVDVDRPRPDGATALHWAVYDDRLDLTDLLVEAGADVDAANDFGVTPLSLACDNGASRMVRRLLDAGADPDIARSTGETPLMTCSRTGETEAVRALLAAGADPNATEAWREQTSLMWGAAEGHTEVVRALVAYGADVGARSHGGFDALLLAARHDTPALVQLLLDAGADVNVSAPDGLTPLHVATVRGHAAEAILLLEHGADPNADGPGYTPLHWASGAWHTELTGSLRGIETARDDEWRSLNEVQTGKLELVEALLAHGADPRARLWCGVRLSSASPAGDSG